MTGNNDNTSKKDILIKILEQLAEANHRLGQIIEILYNKGE